MAILPSDKRDFKSTLVTRDKEGLDNGKMSVKVKPSHHKIRSRDLTHAMVATVNNTAGHTWKLLGEWS